MRAINDLRYEESKQRISYFSGFNVSNLCALFRGYSMDRIKANLYFFETKHTYKAFETRYENPNFMSFKCETGYPGIAFSDVHYPLVSGDVIRFKDNNGLTHIASISKYFTIVIEEIKV